MTHYRRTSCFGIAAVSIRLVPSILTLLGVALLVSSPCAGAQGLFRDGMERVSDMPTSDAEAARFLTQATFGPTRAAIDRVRQIGYSAWLDEQFDTPQTLARPYLESLVPDQSGNLDLNGARIDRWFWTGVYGQDQLRQRMAFALSQIFVVSDVDGNLNGRPTFVAEYWDMLARNAFGNFRVLLEDVTYHPAMALYLTYLRNRKDYMSGGVLIKPDENYAREVMQLFTIGLNRRAPNGALVLNAQGQPIPTYDQSTIEQYARMFTGLSYPGSTFTNGAPNYNPLQCFGSRVVSGQTVVYHDEGAKTLLDGQVTPAVGTTDADCALDIDRGLDVLFNHGNVAPFISRQLIQRFVTSNPSPAYIARVAAVFNNNGQGVRGDLRAVLRAILLDPEARNPVPSGFAQVGKLREPLLRLTAAYRALNTLAPQPDVNGNVPMGLRSPQGDYGQRPLGALTVFNFYEPDFQPPGPLQQANLYAPEFQILNENTVVRMNNSIVTRAVNWFIGMSNPQPNWPLVNLDDLAAIVQTPSATTHGLLLDELNLRLMYGRMSPAMRTVILNYLNGLSSSTSARDRVRHSLNLIFLSAEFAVQK